MVRPRPRSARSDPLPKSIHSRLRMAQVFHSWRIRLFILVQPENAVKPEIQKPFQNMYQELSLPYLRITINDNFCLTSTSRPTRSLDHSSFVVILAYNLHLLQSSPQLKKQYNTSCCKDENESRRRSAKFYRITPNPLTESKNLQRWLRQRATPIGFHPRRN